MRNRFDGQQTVSLKHADISLNQEAEMFGLTARLVPKDAQMYVEIYRRQWCWRDKKNKGLVERGMGKHVGELVGNAAQ